MEYVVLLVAVIALLMAHGARKRAVVLEQELAATRRELLTRGADEGDLGGELKVLRRQVELLAKGLTVDPLSVREKRLYANVNTATLQQRLTAGEKLVVLDVRSDPEWSSGHIVGARHVPADQVEKRLSEVPRDGTPVYCICAGGGRSSSAAEFLANRGFLSVFNVEGGMNSWKGPVTKD